MAVQDYINWMWHVAGNHGVKVPYLGILNGLTLGNYHAVTITTIARLAHDHQNVFEYHFFSYDQSHSLRLMILQAKQSPTEGMRFS